MVVGGRYKGASINEPMQECSASWNHLSCKAEGPNEGEKLSLGTGVFSLPGTENMVQVFQLVWW